MGRKKKEHETTTGETALKARRAAVLPMSTKDKASLLTLAGQMATAADTGDKERVLGLAGQISEWCSDHDELVVSAEEWYRKHAERAGKRARIEALRETAKQAREQAKAAQDALKAARNVGGE